MPSTVRSRLATVPRRRRIRGALSRVRALRHHASAIVREFRTPLAGFVAVTVLGGLLYGELYGIARGVRIPMIDRPYVMLQLMLLEAPEAVPPEWYLVVFWYALPLAFVVLLGLGAADFVDLFFNRHDDRDAWGEALAMTYRKHVVVLGAGHVGLRVVRDLHDMGRELVVVDHSPSPEARSVLERLGVPVVMGDGRETETLERAGLADAEAFVACTADDHVNMQAAMRARKASASLRVVVRMWDPGLAHDLDAYVRVESILSAADLSAPAFAGAAAGIDITQTVEIGGAEYSTVRFEVRPGSFLDGAAVGRLEADEELEVVLLCRNGESELDPEPEREVLAGDDLVVFARHGRVLDVVARNR